jgi:hypothetical protein
MTADMKGMTRAALAVVVALVVVTGLGHVVHAGDRGKAEAYFNAGDQAFRAQDFAAAAEQFELAYKELPLAEIAFSAAQAYRRQYYVDPRPEYVKRAVELYRVYLDHVKTGGRVGDAADGLAEMNRELERLTNNGTKIGEVVRTGTRIAVSVGIVGGQRASLTEVAVMPATVGTGATATLDGKPMELFAPVVVEPGDHTVVVTAPGFVPVTETRHVNEGGTELVAVELVPKPARVTIQTEEGALVAINGHAVGTAPLAVQELPPGTYVVTATRRGRAAVEQQLTVARDEQKTVAMPMQLTGRRRVVPWLAVGAGVLAVGSTVSAILAEHYDNTKVSINDQRTTVGITEAQLAAYHTATSDRDATRAIAFTLGGAAVAAGVTAAAMYYFDVPLPGEHAIVPTVVTGGAGAAVVGHF